MSREQCGIAHRAHIKQIHLHSTKNNGTNFFALFLRHYFLRCEDRSVPTSSVFYATHWTIVLQQLQITNMHLVNTVRHQSSRNNASSKLATILRYHLTMSILTQKGKGGGDSTFNILSVATTYLLVCPWQQPLMVCEQVVARLTRKHSR